MNIAKEGNMKIQSIKTNRTKARTPMFIIAMAVAGVCLTTGNVQAQEKGRTYSKSEVMDAIEDEFIFDGAVPHQSLDMEMNSGVLTIRGTVNNILAKERATVIAETVRGVKSVVNLIDVKPGTSVTAAGLAANIEDALLQDPATESYEVDVNATEKGKVTLTGTVDSWQERGLCATVAKSVRGVTGLENNITVDYDSQRTDYDISKEIERRLKWDVLVDDAMIDVNVDDGNVTLTGTVGSAAEKSQARYNALVAGTENVDVSGLKVERWARDEDLREDKYVDVADKEIEDAVRKAFIYDPRLMSTDVTIKVTDGNVTLRGIVDNAKARQAAEKDARHTVGVIGINNRIKVRPEELLGDAVVESNVRQKLMLDPWLESYKIEVEAVNGYVYLTGRVDSAFEKSHATSVAYGAEGVIEVRNRLSVLSDDTVVVYDPYVWYNYPVSWEFYPAHSEPDSAYPAMEDNEIVEEINSELFWSPFVDSDDITITVNNGIAMLTGTVESMKEKEAATENAFEGGAAGVVNKIDVSSDS